MWTGFIWLSYGPVAGCCEYGNEPSCSMKSGVFLHQQSDSAPCSLLVGRLVGQSVSQWISQL